VKPIDRVLQRWRIDTARAYLRPEDRILDIGCADRSLYDRLGTCREYVGIDPGLDADMRLDRGMLIRGRFPAALPGAEPFDAITLLAVLEHVPPAEQPGLASDCARHLRPGGRLILTVPSPAVDRILAVLKALRLIDGMSLEQHYGFRTESVPSLFGAAGLQLAVARKFQLGLNNLFLFQMPPTPAP
jgi:SAM-dependent methyltransferase